MSTRYFLSTLRAVTEATRNLDGTTGQVELTPLPGGGMHVHGADWSEAISVVIPPSLLDDLVVITRGPVHQRDDCPCGGCEACATP